MQKKFCSKCQKEKLLEFFYKDSSRRDGKDSMCKECHNKLCENWRKRNPDKSRAYTLNWRKRNPDKDTAKTKLNYRMKIITGLRDGYVKQLIIRDTRLRRKDIPQSLVEKKREAIIIRRKLKEVKHAMSGPPMPQ